MIAVSGPDAASFLNGLVSVDVLKLNRPRYALMLTPQGKFFADFFLVPDEERILIDIAGTYAADMLKRLQVYKLRAQVQVRLEDQLHIYAGWGETTHVEAWTDPRLEMLGSRLIISDAEFSSLSAEAYDLHRLMLGVPESTLDMVQDKSLPLECGMDELHGVDFDKGCYVGQEVTARTKYRATIRKRLIPLRAKLGGFPASGTPVMQAEKPVGELRSHRGEYAIALLQLEALHAPLSESNSLHVGDVECMPFIPEWMHLPMSEKNAG